MPIVLKLALRTQDFAIRRGFHPDLQRLNFLLGAISDVLRF